MVKITHLLVIRVGANYHTGCYGYMNADVTTTTNNNRSKYSCLYCQVTVWLNVLLAIGFGQIQLL